MTEKSNSLYVEKYIKIIIYKIYLMFIKKYVPKIHCLKKLAYKFITVATNNLRMV